MAAHYLLWLCYFLLFVVSASNNCPVASAQVLAEPPLSIPKFMKDYGEYKIEHLWIGRQPVQKWVQGFLNLISKKAFSKLKEHYKYDDMYHLYITFRLSNDHYYKIEKNERLAIHDCGRDLGESNTNCVSGQTKYIKELDFVRSKQKKSFNTVIEACEVTYDCFYYYTADAFNCQNFVHRFIHQLGLNDKELGKYDTFILQNGFLDAFKQHGLAHLSKLTKAVTDVAALGGVTIAKSHHSYRDIDNEYDAYDDDEYDDDEYNEDEYNDDEYNDDEYNYDEYNEDEYNDDEYNYDEYNEDEYNYNVHIVLLLITALTFISAACISCFVFGFACGFVGNVYIKT